LDVIILIWEIICILVFVLRNYLPKKESNSKQNVFLFLNNGTLKTGCAIFQPTNNA